MKLEDFLAQVKAKESEIIEYAGQKAIEAVKSDGYALRYVKEQTEPVCLKEACRGTERRCVAVCQGADRGGVSQGCETERLRAAVCQGADRGRVPQGGRE